MAHFFDAKTKQPIERIPLAQGQTFVAGLSGGGPAPDYKDLTVKSGNEPVAVCQPLVRLGHDKKAYYGELDPTRIDTVDTRKGNDRYFQILGMTGGTANLVALLDAGNPNSGYAQSVAVDVQASARVLGLGQLFQELWKKHPSNWAPPQDDPCEVIRDLPQGGGGQCAIRLCIALADGGVNLAGLHGRRCWGQGHKNHFLDPNDVAEWLSGKLKPYTWTATQLAPEPMPGQAALAFVKGKTGIVLFLDFWNEAGAAPTQDHMDMWNGSKIAHGGEAYFLRSRELSFWQIN